MEKFYTETGWDREKSEINLQWNWIIDEGKNIHIYYEWYPAEFKFHPCNKNWGRERERENIEKNVN